MRLEYAPVCEGSGSIVAGDAAPNYTIRMWTRWRVMLAIAGITMLCVSCAALTYAAWPLSPVRDQAVIWSNMFGMP
jgi:hypothetical protein